MKKNLFFIFKIQKKIKKEGQKMRIFKGNYDVKRNSEAK